MNDEHDPPGRHVPHNLAAERATIGAMLLSTEACKTATHMMRPEDFYSPAHGVLFATILRLHHDGTAVDSLIIDSELRSNDTYNAWGGVAKVVDLMAEAPGTANVAHYAATVIEAADRRRLISIANDLSERAYNGETNPADLAQHVASRMVESVTATGTGARDLYQLSWFLNNRTAQRPPWVVPGILRAKWRCMIVAPEGLGKALALDTPVPAPSGWLTMGDLVVGDEVFGSDGKPCKVTFVTPVQYDRDCYEVKFSDGTSVVADADHRWLTQTVNERESKRPWQERTTLDIAESLRVRSCNVANHSIPVCGPLEYPKRDDLPLDPYLLGIWLADGDKRNAMISTADPEIVEAFTDDGWTLRHREGTYDYLITGEKRRDRSNSFRSKLRDLNLLSNKHIPDIYRFAPKDDRQALLQGIMDGDGTCGTEGRAELTLTHERLVQDAYELILGLGHKATIAESAAKINGVEVSRRWRISFHPGESVFRLSRKAARATSRADRAANRYIVAVNPVPSVPVRCIQVDSSDHTYLVSRACIPTHNTMVLRSLAMNTGQGVHPFTGERIPAQRVLMVDCENPDDVILEQCRPIERSLRRSSSRIYDENAVWLLAAEEGMNIRKRADRARLEAAIAEVRPALVCAGPLYKMFRKDGDSDEDATLDVIAVLDDLRARYGFALALEHHAPKKQGGVRDLDPFGSSVWFRWPELGIKMVPSETSEEEVMIARFRRDRVRALWPSKLWREPLGSARPWTGTWVTGTMDDAHGILPAVQKLDRDLDMLFGTEPDAPPHEEGGFGLFPDDEDRF